MVAPLQICNIYRRQFFSWSRHNSGRLFSVDIEQPEYVTELMHVWARILVQVTIYRRLRIGRDDHLDQSEAYTIYRNLYENTAAVVSSTEIEYRRPIPQPSQALSAIQIPAENNAITGGSISQGTTQKNTLLQASLLCADLLIQSDVFFERSLVHGGS